MALAYTAFQRVTADDLNARLDLFVQKTATETVTSSTTLQNDDELVLTLPAGRTYEIQAHLSPTGNAGGDFKTAWTVSGTVTQATTRQCIGPTVSTTNSTGGSSASPVTAAVTVGVNKASAHNVTTAVSYGLDGTNASAVFERFLVTTGASGGTVQLQWAQDTSNAAGTSLSVNSYITAIPKS